MSELCFERSRKPKTEMTESGRRKDEERLPDSLHGREAASLGERRVYKEGSIRVAPMKFTTSGGE